MKLHVQDPIKEQVVIWLNCFSSGQHNICPIFILESLKLRDNINVMTNDGSYRLYYCNTDECWCCCCYKEWQQATDLRLHDNYTTNVSSHPTHTHNTSHLVTSSTNIHPCVSCINSVSDTMTLQHHGQRRSTRLGPATRRVIPGERWSVTDTVSAHAWELQPCSALRCNISHTSHPITRRLVARKERKSCISYRFPALSCLHVLSVIRSTSREC